MSLSSSTGVAAEGFRNPTPTMKIARVYVAKSEVKAMIRREIRKLEGTE
jgi:hypothetical protein